MQRKNYSITSEVLILSFYRDRPMRRFTQPTFSPRHFFFPTPNKINKIKKTSCRDEHNEPLSILTLDLEARVQLGLRRSVRRPAPDDPAGRI
jgi:hypothetical protein